jgi:hypothetical protein
MADTERPCCGCHSESMFWAKDSRSPAGGYWRCAVTTRERRRERYASDPAFREREVQRARDRYDNDDAYREAKLQRQQDRYDNDFIYRAEKQMATARNGRRRRLRVRREQDGLNPELSNWMASDLDATIDVKALRARLGLVEVEPPA